MTTHIIINRSTCRLIIVGLWLWTITTVAFQLQYQQAALSYSRKFMRQSRLYSSEIIDDGENDDVPMIVRAPEHEIEKVFSREIYERKRGDFDAGRQSHGGKSLASTLNITRVQWKPRPIEIIGHRGSPYTALENTARSFVHAALAGAHGVELDVFLLKCGTLVVFHGTGTDENPGLLKSYCGVPGSILDYTAEEARRQLTFDENFEEFGCGPDEITRPGDPSHYCYVHTLEEVLVTMRDHPDVSPDFVVRIELKGPDTAVPTVELVGRLDMARRCRYSSFDHSRILEVRSLDPDAVTGALFDGPLPADFVQLAIAAGADEVQIKYDSCTRDAVRSAHRAGLRTMAWFRGPRGMRRDCLDKYHDVGNEDVDMYRTVLRSGVGCMCVNRPDVMVRALAEARFESIRSLPEQ